MEALATRVENGSLRILVPRRSIHTKLYILERPGTVRIIQTSANLTETARKASQVNYAWYTDLQAEDDFGKKCCKTTGHMPKVVPSSWVSW